eukprot:1160186-Pelagomonas_calceolata.AAC.2
MHEFARLGSTHQHQCKQTCAHILAPYAQCMHFFLKGGNSGKIPYAAQSHHITYQHRAGHQGCGGSLREREGERRRGVVSEELSRDTIS